MMKNNDIFFLMKKMFIILICLCIMLSAVACGAKSSTKNSKPQEAVTRVFEGLKKQSYDTYLLAFDPEDTLRTDNKYDEGEFNNLVRDFIEHFGSTQWDYLIQTVDTYPLGEWNNDKDKIEGHQFLPECLHDVLDEYGDNKHGLGSRIGNKFAICPVEVFYKETRETLYFYLYLFDGAWYVCDYGFSYVDDKVK